MKTILPIFIIGIIILGIIFYWFQWRPAQIREKCFAEAEFDRGANAQVDDATRHEFINNYYDDCLKRFGLEK